MHKAKPKQHLPDLSDPRNLLGQDYGRKADIRTRNAVLTLGGAYLAINVLLFGGLLFNQNSANHARAKEFAKSLKVEPPLVLPRLHGLDEKTPVTFRVSITDSTITFTQRSGEKPSRDATGKTYAFTLGLRDPNKEDDAMEAILANGGTIRDIRGVGHGPGQQSRPGSLMGL